MDWTTVTGGGTGTVLLGVVGWFARERWNEAKHKKEREEERKASALEVLENDIYGHIEECNERREHAAALQEKVNGIDDRLCGMETKIDVVHTKCDTISGQLSVLIARK